MDYTKEQISGRYAITFNELKNIDEIKRGVHIYDKTSITGKLVMFIKGFLLKINYLQEIDIGTLGNNETIVVNRRSLDKWKNSVKAFLGNDTQFASILPLDLKSMVEAVKLKLDTPIPIQESNKGTISESSLDKVIQQSPDFQNYEIKCEHSKLVLTGVNIRPANLFFEKLFEGREGISTTMPGGQLFRFTNPNSKTESIKETHENIRAYCKNKANTTPDEIVSFSAKGKSGLIKFTRNDKPISIPNLTTIYGENIYEITRKEIQETLESQRIYTSHLLPLPFYKGLKQAMEQDNLVILPGNENNLHLLSDCRAQDNAIGNFLKTVEKNPILYGFKNDSKDSFSFKQMLKMTIYQIGAMVVKSEDYRIFMDHEGKIFDRKPNQNDAICLINACGIRGISVSKTPQEFNKQIMTETFKVSLKAAGEGVVIFPAVGMGVWRGDPNLYWRAFLDAVVASDVSLTKIYVNPRHQKTATGDFTGSSGEEFEQILNEYKQKNIQVNLDKLNKICNLYDTPKDVLQLAYNVKKAFPDQKVSVFNASDPDVTLGNHVGEYTNNWPHIMTTEENYTAIGTNGLCFEGITGIHDKADEGRRLIQG